MAQVSFDFLGVDTIDSTGSKDNIAYVCDEDIVQQLETFGYNKAAIISTMNKIHNKNDINAIIDHMESSHRLSRSSSASADSTYSNSTSASQYCSSPINECPSFLLINDLLRYYTKIASQSDTDLNDIFEYANFCNADHNYYTFVASFHHIIYEHMETPLTTKLSFTQTVMDNINGLKANHNVATRDISEELQLISIYLEERKNALSTHSAETKTNSKKKMQFENTLKTISKSSKSVLKNMGEMRSNIEVKQTLNKIKQKAPNMHMKQRFTNFVDHCKEIGDKKKSKKHKHKHKNKHLNSIHAMNPEVQQRIIMHLQSVLMKYESNHKINDKQHQQNHAFDHVQKQLDGDHMNTSFYIAYDKHDQEIFDAFLLDENAKCGRIVHQWLKYIEKYRANIKFDDIGDFIQKLSHTFIHFYMLSKKYSKCMMVLCYRCILRINLVKDMIYDLLHMTITDEVSIYHREYQATLKLDNLYQKKVMWMRVLNRKQLGIKDEYWTEHNMSIKMQSKEQRRVSKIGYFAGSDVPYAHEINLLGELGPDEEAEDKYVKYKEAMQKIKSANNDKSKVLIVDRLLQINKKKNKTKPVVSVSFDYEDKDGEDQNENDEADIVPFNLPHFGLNTLLNAIKCIYETAMKYYFKIHPHKNGDDEPYMISQDDLFPITLYCIIQSRLEAPNKWIYFMEHMLPNDDVNYGQAAFALSAFKAAVSYISIAKPQTFGLDNEIELD